MFAAIDTDIFDLSLEEENLLLIFKILALPTYLIFRNGELGFLNFKIS
jgi:hypothetical protein